MLRIMITNTLSGLIIVSLLSLSCTTKQKRREYAVINKEILSSKDARKSPDRIDNYITQEIYFSLAENADSLRITINARKQPDPITKESEALKTYFIIEKRIELKQYQKDSVFSEIGKNYNFMWDREREITIESDIKDHLRTLDRGSLFRIRFTTFTKEYAEFSITIEADTKIHFFRNMPK